MNDTLQLEEVIAFLRKTKLSLKWYGDWTIVNLPNEWRIERSAFNGYKDDVYGRGDTPYKAMLQATLQWNREQLEKQFLVAKHKAKEEQASRGEEE